MKYSSNANSRAVSAIFSVPRGSYKNGGPAEFPLDRVIKCWTEGVQRLQVGGSARLTCPPSIAYGERGAGGTIPPNTTLQFEVELLGINGR